MNVDLSKNKLQTIKWMCKFLIAEELIHGKMEKRIKSVQATVDNFLAEIDEPKLSPYLRQQAKKDLSKLLFLPPYNVPSNYLFGDGIFAKHIENEYGMSIEELRKECNL